MLQILKVVFNEKRSAAVIVYSICNVWVLKSRAELVYLPLKFPKCFPVFCLQHTFFICRAVPPAQANHVFAKRPKDEQGEQKGFPDKKNSFLGLGAGHAFC